MGLKDDQIKYGIDFFDKVRAKLQSADLCSVVVGSRSLLLSRLFYMSYLWALKGCLVNASLSLLLMTFANV